MNGITMAVCGASGRMGQEVVKAALADSGVQLVGAVDHQAVGRDVAQVVGLSQPCGVLIQSDLTLMVQDAAPRVVVDFTTPQSVFENAKVVLSAGLYSVIGTTGLSDAQREELDTLAKQKGVGVLVAPNFALGGVLMMKFAQEASRYFEHAEIIELHHNQKLDAPSGTALRTAHMMSEARAQFGATNIADEKELITGARGGVTESDIHIHSVRLPGYVAHQEVLFGALGEVLTLRHDSTDRKCFMPGVLLGVKRIVEHTGLVYGLEHLL